ncbi:MAG: SMP-30/gluconolactonase/LRE family protein [Achromobacter sp.]|uniref:SMP-30/gluconolactonase/LRE family protein n=1 Tax=Achromobacter sp. TaxID=134375 RepID=UPI0025839075|nr:SMP-30/gluconolactonase/LRE family protein [Achromobacter sp.]MCW0211214.1 SMP-30/gluconolactonase/LRE family protein [Achromobacter sp.]
MTVLQQPLPLIGNHLNRPESVIALADGRLYACDRLRGVVRADRDPGDQPPVEWPADEFVANGIALLDDGTFLIANVGPRGGAWKLVAPGRLEPFLTEAQGLPRSPLNFLFPDEHGNVWLSLCTQLEPRSRAFHSENADATIGVLRAGSSRIEIVARGLGFSNELRVDPTGRWLYVNETIARRLSRFEIRPGPSLGKRELVCEFGRGTWPDGLEFDEEGGIWLTSVVSNRVLQVDRNGRCAVHIEDCDDSAIDAAERAFAANAFGFEEISTGRNYGLRNLSSIAFGGPDLRTAYLGSLFNTGISVWQAPVAGAKPLHWNVGRTVLD